MKILDNTTTYSARVNYTPEELGSLRKASLILQEILDTLQVHEIDTVSVDVERELYEGDLEKAIDIIDMLSTADYVDLTDIS